MAEGIGAEWSDWALGRSHPSTRRPVEEIGDAEGVYEGGGRGRGRSAGGRRGGGVGRGVVMGLGRALILIIAAAGWADAATFLNATSPPPQMLSFPGSSLVIPFAASSIPPGHTTSIMAAIDINLGLPPHSRAICNGQPYRASSGGCPVSQLTVEISSVGDMGGETFEVCADLIGYNNTVVQARNRTCTHVSVAVVMPSFVGLFPDGTPPEDHHLEAHTGCELSFRVHARDVSPHCSPDVPGSMNGGGCHVSVSLVPEGSVPRTSSGLPEGINGRGGAASFVRDDDESNGVEERWVFRWAPVRGQESMKPYKVCYKAQDARGSKTVTRCTSIFVNKCRVCSQPGDTIGSIAQNYGVDWLHVYTTNPWLKSPDFLAPYTVVNIGVMYSVKRGEYVDFIAEKFFTTSKDLLEVNPDVAAREDYTLYEDDFVCILPPVCDVECDDPNNCRSIKAEL